MSIDFSMITEAKTSVRPAPSVSVNFLNGLNTDSLARGSVASLMKADGAVFETLADGDRVQTMVFVRGLPMPLHVFAFCIGLRMAPQVCNSLGVGRLSLEDERQLNVLWDMTLLPEAIRNLRFGGSPEPNSPTTICLEQINGLFKEHLDGQICKTPSFVEMVRGFDEDYEMSLVEPLRYDCD